MENLRDSKAPKLKSLDRVVLSPIIAPNLISNYRYHPSPMSPIFDPYISGSSDSQSPLVKYLSSPLPSSPLFTTPVKNEEDVLVMDAYPVMKSSKGGRLRMKYSLTSSNSTQSPLSGGGSAEMCRYSEESGGHSGGSRLGSKGQLTNSREDVRPPRLLGKNKPVIYKSYDSSSGSSSSPLGRKPLSINKIAAASLSSPTLTTPNLQSKQNSDNPIIDFPKVPNAARFSSDWNPQDDGIELTLPYGTKNPSKEELDAYIQKVLYGPSSKKRLPVFLEFYQD